MKNLMEVLSKMLPEDQVKEVHASVEDLIKEAKETLDSEYNAKLEEAYAELATEKKKDEQVAEQGYQEALTIITDLRNRIDTQNTEAEKALEQGYEEAYQMLVTEKGKNEALESELHEQYEKKLGDMREFFIDKIDEFFRTKGEKIYEQARRDIINDPRMVEHKVALDKVVDVVSEYISDEDYSKATSNRIQEASKEIEELKGKVRLMEAKNIRLSNDNTKLNESVRSQKSLLTESTKVNLNEERKNRSEKVKNAEGRGEITSAKTKVIAEHVDSVKPVEEEEKGFAGFDLKSMQILAGIKKSE